MPLTPRSTRPPHGTLDVIAAGLLAGLSVAVGWHVGDPVGVAVDLAACAAAALTARWPRSAGTALAVILTAYLFAPSEWATMGQYAALIPILGTGLRNQRLTRRYLCIAYWVVLGAVQYRDHPLDGRWVLGGLIWAALFSILWLLGNGFVAFRHLQQEAKRAALAQQRLGLARDLHDSVARSLARLTLTARQAASRGDTAALVPLADGISQAAGELRWILNVLREPTNTPDPPSHGPLSASLNQISSTLNAHGYPTTASIDSRVDNLPPTAAEVLRVVAQEAAANVERHGSANSPCMLVALVEQGSVHLTITNEIAPTTSAQPAPTRMGLIGAAERLATVGGVIEARAEGRQWITRVLIPQGEEDHDESHHR